VDEIALVGGVLYDARDPVAASEELARLLTSSDLDPQHIRELGFEPSLIQALRRTLPPDPAAVSLACTRGAAWVLGRRSNASDESWHLVASLPYDVGLPLGIRRTTAETLIGLMSEARHLLRVAAPYVDREGIGIFVDAIAAATARGVQVEVIGPPRWPPAAAAFELLKEAVLREGQQSHLRITQARADAPWAHLKVVAVDEVAAYIGSANLTGAGLVGRNLELGVVIRGVRVAAVSSLLKLFVET
jgi:phosphatidylserine/phosphatidylglycerophosphate/cardiolipin synthase-like enzyme